MTDRVQLLELEFGFGLKGSTKANVKTEHKRTVHYKLTKSSDGTPTGIYTDSSFTMDDVSDPAKKSKVKGILKEKKTELENDLPGNPANKCPRIKYKATLDNVRPNPLLDFICVLRIPFRPSTCWPSTPKRRRKMTRHSLRSIPSPGSLGAH